MADEETGLALTRPAVSTGNTGLAAAGSMDFDLEALNASNEENAVIGEGSIHRISILQPGSPEIAKKVKGYEDGMLVDNKTRQILTTKGKAPWLLATGIPAADLPDIHYMEFALVCKLPNEYTKWKTKAEKKESEDGARWWFKVLDPTDPRVVEGVWPPIGTFGRKPEEKGVAPPVTIGTNFLIAPMDFATAQMSANFLIATFGRTSSKAGGLMVDFMREMKARKMPSFGMSQFLYTTMEGDGDNTWWEMKLARGRSLQQYAPSVWESSKSQAMELAGNRTLQLAYLAMDDEDDGRSPGKDTESTVDGDIQQQNDPFRKSADAPAF